MNTDYRLKQKQNDLANQINELTADTRKKMLKLLIELVEIDNPALLDRIYILLQENAELKK